MQKFPNVFMLINILKFDAAHDDQELRKGLYLLHASNHNYP